MNRLYLIAMLFFFNPAAFATNDSRSLTWGYVNFAPYHYIENENVAGVIAQQVKYIFNDAKLTYSAVELPNKRAKLYITQGRVDFSTVIESFISTPNNFLKSNLPIYRIVLGAVCLDDSLNIKELNDLKQLRLILLSGYTYGTQKQINEQSGYNIELHAQNHDSAVKALKYKRADCVLGYESPTRVEQAKHADLKLTFYKIDEFPVYLYLNKQVKNAPHIMDTINQHINRQITPPALL